ncbi:hypothetical protein AVEN_272159-1 [Araneus ventricosus]|uniref:Uncharacterized protein n=1 Tax=Araneus ventricosus TaxID=182803 RepID=A0A4Y2BKA2_ARAVE|nr:hypothetical protein AVEN_196978-1 [Araneus ventricosus]GBL91799.1 hypothetical protein AVEN_272159-1 [Araneus ventricosus]
MGTCLPCGHAVKVEEAPQRHGRVQTREEGWENLGHYHGCVRHLLAALLRDGSAHGPLHLLRTPSPALLAIPLARISQLHPQPTHLHPLQPGLQEGVRESDMGKAPPVGENMNAVVEGCPAESS